MCQTLRNPLDSSPPGSSLHGTSQARTLDWVAFPSPEDLPDPEIEPSSLYLLNCRGFSTHRAIRGALFLLHLWSLPLCLWILQVWVCGFSASLLVSPSCPIVIHLINRVHVLEDKRLHLSSHFSWQFWLIHHQNPLSWHKVSAAPLTRIHCVVTEHQVSLSLVQLLVFSEWLFSLQSPVSTLLYCPR